MRTADVSTYIVLYNMVIGILIVLASEKIASFALQAGPRSGPTLQRYVRTGMLTFGASVATLSAAIYVLFHVLRLGLD